MSRQDEIVLQRLSVLLVVLLSLGLPVSAGGGGGEEPGAQALESPKGKDPGEDLVGELRVVKDGPGSKLVLITADGAVFEVPRGDWQALWPHQGRRVAVRAELSEVKSPETFGPREIIRLVSWELVE